MTGDPDIDRALRHMENATTADEAMNWLWRARDLGVTWQEARAAWEHREQQRDRACRCGHVRDTHTTDRHGRGICVTASCGCAEFRAKDDDQ